MQKLYRLFSNCIPIKGYNRSMIVDLQRQKFNFIPNSLYDIISKSSIINFDKLKDENSNYIEIIHEYYTFLQENEYVFEIELSEDDCFIPLNTNYKNPFILTNAIIDLDENSNYSLYTLGKSFEILGISALQIRCYGLNITKLIEILTLFNEDSRLRFIELYLPFSEDIKPICENLITQYERIYQIIVVNSPENKIFDSIIYSTKKINNHTSCGIIEKNFTITLELYIESIHHNSCLHKKIAIDKDGYIRNCPSMPEHFGNIKDTTLEEAINKPGFKKYWSLTKDQIEVCKDCEFRYICTDCRAYTERTHTNTEGLDTSKPLKCGYNPYTGEWEEWSTNPLKQKAIDYYGMREIL